VSEKSNEYYLKNREKILSRFKKYYNDNKEIMCENNKKYIKKHPWIRTFKNIKTRIKHDKCYFNIKCLITTIELQKLWFRDNAFLMKQPSIDRINTYGHYCYDNCRYIEMQDNRKRKHRKIIYLTKQN
jgi:hypothetical protein